jgi:hypothetical protein
MKKVKLFLGLLWMIFLSNNLYAQKVKVQIEYKVDLEDTIKISETFFDEKGKISTKCYFGIIYESIITDSFVMLGSLGQDSIVIAKRFENFSDSIGQIENYFYDSGSKIKCIKKLSINYDIFQNIFDTVLSDISFQYLPNHKVKEIETFEMGYRKNTKYYYQDNCKTILSSGCKVIFDKYGNFFSAKIRNQFDGNKYRLENNICRDMFTDIEYNGLKKREIKKNKLQFMNRSINFIYKNNKLIKVNILESNGDFCVEKSFIDYIYNNENLIEIKKTKYAIAFSYLSKNKEIPLTTALFRYIYY